MSLDLRTGQPVWTLNGLRTPRHNKLTKNLRCEVLVVGGGISGALIAHTLTNLGMHVTILDGREIGAGSTSASTAILSYEADVNLMELIRAIGQKSAVRAYQAGVEAINSLGETIKTLDDSCDFTKRRSVYLASRPKDVKLLERECKTRQKYGFRVRLLGRAELAETFLLKAPCGIVNEDGAQVNPLKLTFALIRSAEKKGLRIFAHTKVQGYRRQGKDCVLTTEDGFVVHAKQVVFATGYETQQLLKQAAVELVSSYAIASKPGVKFPKRV